MGSPGEPEGPEGRRHGKPGRRAGGFVVAGDNVDDLAGEDAAALEHVHVHAQVVHQTAHTGIQVCALALGFAGGLVA